MNARQQARASHHSSALAPGVKRPRHRKTLGLQRYQRCADCRGHRAPEAAARFASVTGPSPSSRPRRNLDQCVLGQPLPLQPRRRGKSPARAWAAGTAPRIAAAARQRPRAQPRSGRLINAARFSPARLGQPVSPALAARDLLLAEEAEPDQRVRASSSALAGAGQGLSAGPRAMAFGIEPAEIGGGSRDRASGGP